MMIIHFPLTQQDTVRGSTIVQKDSLGFVTDSMGIAIKTDSVFLSEQVQKRDSVVKKPLTSTPRTLIKITDTTSVCFRNSVADITFYNPDNFVSRLESSHVRNFPYILIEKSKQIKNEERLFLIKSLKSGQELPYKPYHGDWITAIILFAASLFALITALSKGLIPVSAKFLLFRGISDPIPRDTEAIFNWQSTIFNLFSFIVIALFSYFVASYHTLIPPGIKGNLFWVISFGIIVVAITLRHFICVITGNISGEKEAFRDYLISIYYSFRLGAMFLFLVIIIISYTVFIPVRIGIAAGIIVILIMYLIRLIRLTIIFMNRNISIFYLILYLCALEILPVLISVKYFTGLI